MSRKEIKRLPYKEFANYLQIMNLEAHEEKAQRELARLKAESQAQRR